jgi:hypothetical protein
MACCPSWSLVSKGPGLTSGVGKRLDHAPAKMPLEVAFCVEPGRLEPGGPCLLRGTPEQLSEIGQGQPELAVGRQRHLVDIGLRARDRVVVEPRGSCGDRLDLVVKLVVGDGPVDVPVLLRARPVEVVGDEEELKRAARPASRESLAIGPPPATSPIPASNWPCSVFSRDAKRRSHASPNSLPVPRAHPRPGSRRC